VRQIILNQASPIGPTLLLWSVVILLVGICLYLLLAWFSGVAQPFDPKSPRSEEKTAPPIRANDPPSGSESVKDSQDKTPNWSSTDDFSSWGRYVRP